MEKRWLRLEDRFFNLDYLVEVERREVKSSNGMIYWCFLRFQGLEEIIDVRSEDYDMYIGLLKSLVGPDV